MWWGGLHGLYERERKYMGWTFEKQRCLEQTCFKWTIELARKGIWDIVLTPRKKVSKNWFSVKMQNKNVLCLASGGGQQGPIMAALGAIVGFYEDKEESALDGFIDSTLATKAVKLWN